MPLPAGSRALALGGRWPSGSSSFRAERSRSRVRERIGGAPLPLRCPPALLPLSSPRGGSARGPPPLRDPVLSPLRLDDGGYLPRRRPSPTCPLPRGAPESFGDTEHRKGTLDTGLSIR